MANPDFLAVDAPASSELESFGYRLLVPIVGFVIVAYVLINIAG